MNWSFLLGMIAGAACFYLVLKWWISTHVKRVDISEILRQMENEEEEKAHE